MADLVTSRQFVDGERGITAQKLNDIVGSSVIQPAFYSSKPTAPTADPADIALILKAGAYAQVPISSLAGSATQAQIWDTRLRSYNAIGNPNFEVDQRLCGAFSVLAAGGIQDRWARVSGGTMVLSSQQASVGQVVVPGTDFPITQYANRTQIQTSQASLGAGDYFQIYQTIEGPNFRELGGAHSLSILARSSVANLKFSVGLSDPTASKSLVKLCTLVGTGWTLIQLPNLPVMAGGTFSTAPGVAGYGLHIVLACGSTYIAPAADTWQTGNFIGAPGMSNFAANPVNSTFDIAFVQHEPGSICTTLMDKPFSQNLDECLRYFQKSYPYASVIGSAPASYARLETAVAAAGTYSLYGPVAFLKRMAKTPTVIAYHHGNGTPHSVYIWYASSGTIPNAQSTASISAYAASDIQITNMTASGNSTSPIVAVAEWTADTGW